MSKFIDARTWMVVTVLLSCLVGSGGAEDLPRTAANSCLDRGFAGLYNLDFVGAQNEFSSWEKQHPEDPVGPVSEAAGFLFSEFNRLGVLEAQFFENDSAFAGRPKLNPDPALRERFQNAITRAESLAHSQLQNNPQDRDALFAL